VAVDDTSVMGDAGGRLEVSFVATQFHHKPLFTLSIPSEMRIFSHEGIKAHAWCSWLEVDGNMWHLGCLAQSWRMRVAELTREVQDKENFEKNLLLDIKIKSSEALQLQEKLVSLDSPQNHCIEIAQVLLLKACVLQSDMYSPLLLQKFLENKLGCKVVTDIISSRNDGKSLYERLNEPQKEPPRLILPPKPVARLVCLPPATPLLGPH